MNLLKIPPKGIDKPIQRHQGALYGALKNDVYASVLTEDNHYEAYGRCNVLKDETGFYPAVYLRAGEYREVLLDDTKKLLSFYGTSNTTEHQAGGRMLRDVHLIMFAKISELEATNHRPDEDFRRKVIQALRKLNFGLTFKGEVVGVEDSLAEYTSERVKGLVVADMQPWHVCRFNFSCEYHPDE